MDDAQDESESEDPEEGFEEGEAGMGNNLSTIMVQNQGPGWQHRVISGMMNDVVDLEGLLYNSGSDEYDDEDMSDNDGYY